MSDVADMIDTNDNLDSDWDNIEETAPSMADGETSEEGEQDEWAALGNEDSEDSSKDSDDDSQEDTEASGDDDGVDGEEAKEVAEPKDEDDTAQDEEQEGEEKSLSLDEMDDETKISVKVDGELQEISLKEFKSGISGEKAIAKRFNEYNVKEKEFESQMNDVNEYINELGNTMRDASIMDGVSKIGELVGMPPHQLKEALLREIAPELERRYGMSEEEINLELKSQENDYLRNKTESDNQRLQHEQASRELDARVYDLRETHNISSDEWKDAEATLAQADYSKEEITPDLVVKYTNFNRAETRSNAIIESFDSSYLEDNEVMDALVEQVYDNPNLSDDDFRDILETALGKTKTEEAEKKVEAAVKAQGKNKKTKESKESEGQFASLQSEDGEELDDWDDLL